MGSYSFRKQEDDFSVFKNVYGTVSPPDCTPSACEGCMSRAQPCCHTRVTNKNPWCPWWGWSDGTRVLLREPLADFSWEQQVHGTVAREFCKYSRGRQECDGERGNEVRARPGSEGMGLLRAGAGSGCPALLHLPQGSRAWLAGGHWHTLAGGKQFLFCTQEELPRDRRRWRHSHRLFSWMPSSPTARESILVGHRARE